MGIPSRDFREAVGTVGNLLLVFHGFHGWDSINDAEHCRASVNGCTDLNFEILRLGLHLRQRFNA